MQAVRWMRPVPEISTSDTDDGLCASTSAGPPSSARPAGPTGPTDNDQPYLRDGNVVAALHRALSPESLQQQGFLAERNGCGPLRRDVLRGVEGAERAVMWLTKPLDVLFGQAGRTLGEGWDTTGLGVVGTAIFLPTVVCATWAYQLGDELAGETGALWGASIASFPGTTLLQIAGLIPLAPKVMAAPLGAVVGLLKGANPDA